MPSLEELRYFLTIAKTQNVSRAAELSGLSQPALSHALKRLEGELSTQLFFREKTGVHLTRAGEQFAVEARGLVEKWDSIASSLKAQENAVSGHFKIGCHPSVAIYSLPTFLKELLNNNPLLEIGLHHGKSRDIVHDIIEWKVDFGLVINPPKHPDLVIKEIARDEVTLWVSREDHLEDTLIFDSGLFQTQSILKQLEKKKLKFARTIESSTLEVIQALTASGCGVGIIPTRVAQAEAKKLTLFSPSSPIFEDRLCLVYRSGHQRQAGGRAILNAILSAKI